MILVDTSVWVDHLRAGNRTLARSLETGTVLMHPFVFGEIVLGNLRRRDVILDAISDLPRANIATDAEVLQFIDERALYGSGIGYIDTHLLAASTLTPGTTLWTYDKRLRSVAEKMGLAMTWGK